VILAAPAIAQVAPEGTATKSPAIDFMAPIRNPRGEPLTSCPEPEPPGAGATAEQVAAWQKKKTTCAAPPSLGEIVAQALYAPETDAQGKAAPIDAKHARNLALAFQIQAARAPLDLREEQKDDIKAALFNAYRGSIVFETCVMIKSPADCAIPPPAK
jgi:hypothetical protein